MVNTLFSVLDYLRSFPAQIKALFVVLIFLIIFLTVITHKISKLNPEDDLPHWSIPFITIVDFVNNYSKESIGKRWRSYAPYYVTIIFYIFFCNISGLFGMRPPTSYILVNAGLALISFCMVQYTSFRSNGFFGYFKDLCEPFFLLLPINLIGEIILPVSLTLRLTGNLLAGMVISEIIIAWLGWIGILVLPVVNLAIDLFAACIQTTVFLMLTINFTSMKVSSKDKEFIEGE